MRRRTSSPEPAEIRRAQLVSATVGSGRNELSSSRTYLDSDNGKIVLVLGVLVLLVSLATLLRPHRDIVWSVVVAACSLAALGLAVHDRIDLDDVGSEIQSRLAASGTTGSVHVSIGPALYIAIAGGIVATVGAVIAARDRSV